MFSTHKFAIYLLNVYIYNYRPTLHSIIITNVILKVTDIIIIYNNDTKSRYIETAVDELIQSTIINPSKAKQNSPNIKLTFDIVTISAYNTITPCYFYNTVHNVRVAV